MNERDGALVARLRELDGSLGRDIDRLADLPHPESLAELGERLADLGYDLLRRAAELRAAEAHLPGHRWVPAASATLGLPRLAHYLGDAPTRAGLSYVAVCGAPCYPFYGRDTARRIARHPRCSTCESQLPS